MLCQKIMCFVYNKVGVGCLKFLVNNFSSDHYTVVFHNKCENEINDFKNLKNVSCIPLEKFLVDNFENCNFDWLLSLCCGYIFPNQFLKHFQHTLNIHPGYLPLCRGNDPAAWTIRYHFKAGVSLHCISPTLDGGDIWVREELPYPISIKAKKLHIQLHDLCIQVFCKYWKRIRNLEIVPLSQNYSKNNVAFTRKMFLQDTIIHEDEIMSVKDFILRVNSHDFSPNYTAICKLDNKKYKITLNLEEIYD